VGVLGGAAALVFAVGFLDDRRGVGPALKAAPQLLAAVLIVLFVARIDSVLLPGGITLVLGGLAGPLTVFWLVGFSNGYNFMDGIDGIAAVHAGVAAALFSVAGWLGGAEEVLWLSLPLAGASLAFLSVNRPPAKVFMGDCGSLPVGFLLAALAVLGHVSGGVPFVTSFLILGPFLFDTLYTLSRRLWRGENVLEPHRSHLYQRLVISGLSHASVTVLYGVWTLLAGGLGILYLSGGVRVRGFTIAGALVSGIAVVLFVRRREGLRARNG
jgi:UDP-N-acetylmuramyl pentapeptide phosphotransferase/UDP-N-acetylglucosamine-1-phosphate transferase